LAAEPRKPMLVAMIVGCAAVIARSFSLRVDSP
jgi:hypothetical protein